jgi:hypothetical protein
MLVMVMLVVTMVMPMVMWGVRVVMVGLAVCQPLLDAMSHE